MPHSRLAWMLSLFNTENCSTLEQHRSGKSPNKFGYWFLPFFQQFGNKVGKAQFRRETVPTYVYTDCLKPAIRERLSGQLRDYPDP